MFRLASPFVATPGSCTEPVSRKRTWRGGRVDEPNSLVVVSFELITTQTQATIDANHLTRQVTCFVAGQKRHHAGNLLRLTHAP